MRRRVITKVTAAVLSAVFAVAVLAGCGSGKTENTGNSGTPAAADVSVEAPMTEAAGKEAAEEKKDVSPQALYDEIKESFELPDMYLADDDFLMNYYGIDAALLDSYVFASAEDSTRVDSVIIMKVKDTSSISEIEKGLNGLISQMEVEMDNYQPEAYKLVSASKVNSTGDYVILVISSDEEAINSLVSDRLK